MDHCKCSSLFNASKASLKLSGLINWDGEKFVANYPANDDLGFEKYARTKFDHDYGRYICWILLSVGAENLAKAACVCSSIKKGTVSTLGYPIYDKLMPPLDWANKVLSKSGNQSDAPQAENHHFGALGSYWKTKGYFDKLCENWQVDSNDRKILKASYKFLTQVIRNRDVHTYVASQRKTNFPAVKPIFVPSFNILVDTMKANGHFGSSCHT